MAINCCWSQFSTSYFSVDECKKFEPTVHASLAEWKPGRAFYYFLINFLFLLKTRGRILWWGELRAPRRSPISTSAPCPRHVSHCVTYQLWSVSTRENVNERNHQIERRNEKRKEKDLWYLTYKFVDLTETLSRRHETVEIVIFTGTLTWMASPGVKWVINPPLTRWAPRNL